MSGHVSDDNQFDGFAPRDQGFSLLRTPRQTVLWYLRATPFDRRPRNDPRPRGRTTKAGPATRPRTHQRDGTTSAILRGLLPVGVALATVVVLLAGLALLGLSIISTGVQLSSLTSGHGVVPLRLSGFVEPFVHSHAPGVGWHRLVGSYRWYWTCLVVSLLILISVGARVGRVVTTRRYRRRRLRAAHSLTRTAMVRTREAEIEQARARFEESLSAPPKRSGR